MDKQGFLGALRAALAGMPREEMEERLTFYSEMIDDRIEEGLTEEAALAGLGPVEEVAAQILSESPSARLEKQPGEPGRGKRGWAVVLLVLGSPVWLPLLIAALIVALAAYVVLWSLLLSLWAVEFSLGVCALTGGLLFGVCAVRGSLLSGVALLGVGFVCAGLTIFGAFGCKWATKAVLAGTKKIWNGMSFCFKKKERAV